MSTVQNARLKAGTGVAATALTLAVCLAAADPGSGPVATSFVHPDYAVSMDSPRKATGWADDVFVGKVVGMGSNAQTSDGAPMTVYTVEVVRSLKGRSTGMVKVAQEGGYDPVAKEHVVVGDAPALATSGIYVLATRVSPDGWNTAPSNFTPVLLPAKRAEASLLATWEKAVASPERQKDLFPSLIASVTERQRAALYAKAKAS